MVLITNSKYHRVTQYQHQLALPSPAHCGFQHGIVLVIRIITVPPPQVSLRQFSLQIMIENRPGVLLCPARSMKLPPPHQVGQRAHQISNYINFVTAALSDSQATKLHITDKYFSHLEPVDFVSANI